ncbi:MAG: hypothetical protein ABSG53_31240, partial [Thermoguttaceae bacterium]
MTSLDRCFRRDINFNPIDFTMAAQQCDFVTAVHYLEPLCRISLQMRSMDATNQERILLKATGLRDVSAIAPSKTTLHITRTLYHDGRPNARSYSAIMSASSGVAPSL